MWTLHLGAVSNLHVGVYFPFDWMFNASDTQ